MFDLEDYNYDLPPHLIAQVPVSKRDHSRLFVLDRAKQQFFDRHFFDLPELLKPGDLVVVNDTGVMPARLFGHRETGGRVEILVLETPDPGEKDAACVCMLKSSKRPRAGSVLFFDEGVSAKIREVMGNGLVRLTFAGGHSVDRLLEEKGHMPLPPYIKRKPGGPFEQLDKKRYQTVYSKTRGAVAAPTAGLHFTENLIRELNKSGIPVVPLTLHVGYGTFRPVRTPDIRNHVLAEEYYKVEPETAEAINRTKGRGGRVVAVGTTVVRTLETIAASNGTVVPREGKTGLLITPGFSFRVVDILITNFHLPKSSLLFLVSAFAGPARIRDAYASAIKKGYRFYSYGDAMLIL